MKFSLIEKREEARDTKSFFWQSETPINFQAGQYIYYTLPKLNYPDPRGATRHFTISSSPLESNFIRLTTRIRKESGYKKTLDELPIGSIVEAQGPNGTFIFNEQEQGPQVFLTGGIGITAFRSMIKYDIDKNLEIPIYLIYSNSDEEFVFKKEFEEWQKSHTFIKAVFWNTGVSGHLDQPKIEQLMGNWKLETGNCTLWVCGPPPFIDAMEGVLVKMKVPSDKTRSEKFTGY